MDGASSLPANRIEESWSYQYPLAGYHHITACAGGAQEDIDFFTQAVGLRMAKQTVLMDGRSRSITFTTRTRISSPDR